MNKKTGSEEVDVELLKLNFTLPPPIYKDTLSTKPQKDKTAGLVTSIKRVGDIFVVEQGKVKYHMPVSNAQYWIEE